MRQSLPSKAPELNPRAVVHTDGAVCVHPRVPYQTRARWWGFSSGRCPLVTLRARASLAGLRGAVVGVVGVVRVDQVSPRRRAPSR